MTTTDTGPLDGEALLRIARAVERLDVSWREGGPIVLEDLLQDVAGAERRALLRDALYVELKHRRDRGETPEAGEYERRFPGDDAAIRAVFAEPETIEKPAEVTTQPRTSEFVDEPLRDDAGKVRRSALRDARLKTEA